MTSYLLPNNITLTDEDSLTQVYSIPSIVETSFAALNIGDIRDPVISLNDSNKTVSYSCDSLTINKGNNDSIMISNLNDTIYAHDGSTLSSLNLITLSNLKNLTQNIFFDSYTNNEKKLKGYIAAVLVNEMIQDVSGLSSHDLSLGADTEFPDTNLNDTILSDVISNLETLLDSYFDNVDDSQSFYYWKKFTVDVNNNIIFENNDKIFFVIEVPFQNATLSQSGTIKFTLSLNVIKTT
tara:strand:+ start:1215 stop:1928 length:714 start_codon:yes stop_codon:yes gene_type:complete